METYVSEGWEFSSTTEDTFLSKTCGMLGANPPSIEKCGRPATVRAVNSSGDVHYWCSRCRKKHWPTVAEIAENERQRKKEEKTSKILGFVWWAVKAVFTVGAAVWLISVLPSLVLQIAGGIVLGGLVLYWLYSRAARV
jgi:hypothetical protein